MGVVVLGEAAVNIGSLADIGFAFGVEQHVDDERHKKMAPRPRFELAIRRGELTAAQKGAADPFAPL